MSGRWPTVERWARLGTFARALFSTNLRSALALRTAFAIQAIFMALNNLVFFVFWWVLLRRVPDVRGWRLADLEMLFGTTATSFGLVVAVAGGVRHLGRTIDEGELDTLLTQPKPALLYAVGMRSSAAGVGDMASGIGFLILSGHLTLANAPLLVLVVAAAAAVLLGTAVAFFSLAFWVGRAESISRALWEMLVTFSLYPEPLFGGALRLLLFTLLPAGFVSYLPIAILRRPSLAGVAALAAGAALYLAIGAWTFALGLRRYASGSRFVAFG
jgi:viologen exporter family transport system permease protein